jgi:hypothetical protein
VKPFGDTASVNGSYIEYEDAPTNFYTQ